jgi:hypothetical protein
MLQVQNPHSLCEFRNYMSGSQLSRFALVIETNQESRALPWIRQSSIW